MLKGLTCNSSHLTSSNSLSPLMSCVLSSLLFLIIPPFLPFSPHCQYALSFSLSFTLLNLFAWTPFLMFSPPSLPSCFSVNWHVPTMNYGCLEEWMELGSELGVNMHFKNVLLQQLHPVGSLFHGRRTQLHCKTELQRPSKPSVCCEISQILFKSRHSVSWYIIFLHDSPQMCVVISPVIMKFLELWYTWWY